MNEMGFTSVDGAFFLKGHLAARDAEKREHQEGKKSNAPHGLTISHLDERVNPRASSIIEITKQAVLIPVESPHRRSQADVFI